MEQNLKESNCFEISERRLNDEEFVIIFTLGFDSNGMKRKIFDEKNRKEKKLCYFNEYLVYEFQPIDNHPCYQLLDKLGEGSFGQVLKVRIKAGDLKNEILALKRCELGTKREENLRMLREVIAHMRLLSYEMITFLHYWIEYDERNNEKPILNLCIELADQNLRNWMKTNKKREYKTVVQMIYDICESIEFIHSRGIVHRDLKPENILIKDGKCKLCDFGASAFSSIKFESDEQFLKTWIRTFSYMAPEVNENKEYTNKVDIFSLGLIFMELMIEFDDEKQCLEAFKNLKEYSMLPEIFSSNLIEEGKVILAMTNHDPNKRPDIRKVFSNFVTTSGYRDTFRTGEYDGELDEESFISYKNDELKSLKEDGDVNDFLLNFYDAKIAMFDFDERMDFKEEFLGKCSFGEVTLRKYTDGTQLVNKRMVLKKFDKNKIEKLLSDVVQIAKTSYWHNKIGTPDIQSSILLFHADVDLNKLTLFTQTDYCQDSLVNWMRNNQDRFDEKKKFRAESSLPFFSQVISGIKVMKSMGLVHRDLKPSNIFLGFDYNWKISDCGLSRLRLLEYECEQDYYQSLIAQGVPVYAAPEQVNHLSEVSMTSYQQHLSQYKIDIFSLGLIMIEYLIPILSHQTSLFEALGNIRNQYLLPESLDRSIFETNFYDIILGMVTTNPIDRLDIGEVSNKYSMLEIYKIEKEKSNKYHVVEPVKSEKIIKRYAHGLKGITSNLMFVNENVGLITTNYEPDILLALRLKQLQHLDLSNCALIDDGEALVQLDCLKTLILYNCPRLDRSIDNIVKMSSLRYLDISTSFTGNYRYGHHYGNISDQLKMIITGLINLTHLDISGTNIAAIHIETREIEAFSSLSSPLEFLGILKIFKRANSKIIENIPAKIIAGDANESQLLTACEVYMDRIAFFLYAIYDLKELFD